MWLTSHESAKWENISERTIRRRVGQGKYGDENVGYRYVDGRGHAGKALQVSSDMLTAEAQARYYGEQLACDDETEQEFLSLTDAQRELCFERIAVVRGYKDFKVAYGKADKMCAYLQQYNDDHPDRPINKRKLNHWEVLYNRDGAFPSFTRRYINLTEVFGQLPRS